MCDIMGNNGGGGGEEVYIIHTYLHTYIHTCMHTYIHIHIHTYVIYTIIMNIMHTNNTQHLFEMIDSAMRLTITTYTLYINV